jgi:hypothetical protein
MKKCGADRIHADEEFRIAGAFKDGKQIVVEPLSLSLLYPDSRPDGRVMQLAQHLSALYSCVEIIAKDIVRCVLDPSCSPFPSFYHCYLARGRLQQTYRVAHACSLRSITL